MGATRGEEGEERPEVEPPRRRAQCRARGQDVASSVLAVVGDTSVGPRPDPYALYPTASK